MSSKDYIQSPKMKNLGSHYKPTKGRLQEKKRILILVVCLRPLGLDASQNPTNLFLNLVLRIG